MVQKRMGQFLAAALAATLLGGCGAGSGRVSVNPINQEITVKDGNGSVSIQGKEGRLPDGFPLPVYSGAKVMGAQKSSSSDGKTDYIVTLLATAPPKEIANFYEQALKDRGVEVTRNDITVDGEETFTLASDSDKIGALVTITKKAGQNETQVGIMYGDK